MPFCKIKWRQTNWPTVRWFRLSRLRGSRSVRSGVHWRGRRLRFRGRGRSRTSARCRGRRRRVLWRRWRVQACGAGAEAEALQTGCVELAARIEIVGGLKLLKRGDGGAVPLPVRITLVIAFTRKRGLNFADSLWRGGLLERLAARAVVRGLLFLVRSRSAGRVGGLRGSALSNCSERKDENQRHRGER